MTTIAKQGELTYIDANKNKTILYPITKSECVIGLESTTKTITIQPSEWVNGVYTLNDPLITETSNQDILPPVATGSNNSEIDAYEKAKILDAGQSAGKAMLRCLGVVPTTPITIRVVFNSGHAKPTSLTFDMIYPVGSIYMSVNDVNPSVLFGGTWEQIKDRFLLASGTTYAAGSIGGEATHVLTAEEMPRHSHRVNIKCETTENVYSTPNAMHLLYDCWNTDDVPHGKNLGNYFMGVTSENGDSKPFNNMPPYLTVYIWKRTA